ncbi:MAG: metallopeptidase TldD-related protein [Candidatus Gracilibacteria bacterium]|nr:metallopeptidase TldD-related protein [Candidatus Gracilibacteria bacterium]
MVKIDNENIIHLFKKYSIEGYININISNAKNLEYSPLHDEVSLDSNENINTSITIIKENKKSVFGIDSYSLEKIEFAIKDMLKVIDFGECDKDIILPNITDKIKKDFSNPELENISFEDLEAEFLKFKNFDFAKNIFIETFSIGVNYATHHYINSLGAFKTQIDNSSFYYIEIFGENEDKKENHYKYCSSKDKPNINLEDIKKLQDELIFKLSDSKIDFKSGIYDITLDREVVIEFLDIILGNMGAESIREGTSLFSKNKIGDKIFGENFTLINNPELKDYTGTMLFDKEGITAKKTILFEKGVFKSKFYDYKNALKEGLENLGNSTISNIELVGESDKNYLVGSKILFTNLMAFHTVDESTGKFSLNGEGYLLENGEKKDYIKNISLSGNIINLFSNIKSIGDDFKTDGNFKVPSISFSKQKVI